MNLARMRTCGGGGTRETAVGGSLLLCCTCARGLRMPPCLSCSWKFPLSAEIAPCVAGVEIRGRARRPAVVSLSCTRLRQNLHRERKARERKNTALRPLLLVPSARLATSVERKGEARQGAGGRNGMRNGRERKRRQGRERPGRDGGRPLVGRASEFRPPSLCVRVVIVGQEWLRQVQQSSRTRGTDSIGDAICLMVLQLLSCSVRISSRVIELASEK